MATTETRTGFRLPWSQDHTDSDDPSGEAGAAVAANDSASTTVDAAGGPSQETERPDMIDATPGVIDDTPVRAETSAATAFGAGSPAVDHDPAGTAPAAARKPNRLMADLAKAMQTAAQGARTDTLAKFAADAKGHIGTIQADSATEAADLRRQADDDIAGIRDWSKSEIARIREQTESRITSRKTGLDGELEDHAASTDRRIARVQARVDAFEAEMAYFFEILFAEEDPTKLAAMAQSLPEPPDFDDETADIPVAHVPVATEPEMEAHAEVQDDPDAAFAAIAAAARAADIAEAEAAAVAESAAETHTEPVESTTPDARLELIGLSPDAAADAEAASFEAAEAGSSDDEIPTIDDDALAARIAGLVPEAESHLNTPRAETVSTRVVVVGLVSVASIASFKRHLGRATGVQSVGVSSGPDGEFVFVVNHAPDFVLRDVVASLPGFGARVSGETDEGLQVTARDPEAES
jgi:hypothetical protein